MLENLFFWCVSTQQRQLLNDQKRQRFASLSLPSTALHLLRFITINPLLSFLWLSEWVKLPKQEMVREREVKREARPIFSIVKF